jgi:hypothetical protein
MNRMAATLQGAQPTHRIGATPNRRLARQTRAQRLPLNDLRSAPKQRQKNNDRQRHAQQPQ